MGRIMGLLVLATVLAAAAVASIARGPAVLRLAEPADATPRSGYAATTQVWRLLTTDASSRSLLLLTVDGSDSSTAAQLTYWPTVPQRGLSQTFHDLGSPGRAPGFSVRGISLSNAGGRWKLALDEGTVKLRLTLSLVRRGATATNWPVGTITGPGSPTYRSTFDWSVPVATARASGWIGYDGHRSAISGWRGYLDHTWGRFSLGDGLMQHWDWAVAQGARGTWIVNGFETGQGVTQWKPHDTLWAGVLVHSGSRGTSFCRARVARSGWTTFYAGVNGYVYPRTLAASCGGLRVTFSRRQNAYDYERGWAESSARTSVGGYGLFVEQDRVGS